MSAEPTSDKSSQIMPTVVRVGWILLLVSFAVQGIVGYSVALAIDTPLWDWHQERVGLALWGEADYPAEADAYRQWMSALLGGTISCWAVAMIWIVAIPMRRRESWAWWAIITSTLVWFSIDTAISALHGVGINVFFNVMALSMIAIPLAMTWSWSGSGDEDARQ